MANSDQHLKIATDIAYQDLDKIIEEMPRQMRENPTLDQINTYAKELGKYDIVQTIDKKLNMPEHENLKDDILQWRIVDVHNKNNENENGFYGVAIDTGEELVVSFRGSESFTDQQHAKQDWVDADLALVNSASTAQQAEAEKFLEKIQNSDYIHQFEALSFVGHSLGGNLAFHATIESANREKYPDIYARLQQSINFDGPGFSNEYIEEHADQIALVSDKMDHYQWSVVGTILEPLPDVNFETLAAKSSDGHIGDKFLHYIGGKHTTDSLVFDETGKAKTGDITNYEYIVGKFTEFVDRLPQGAGNLLVDTVGGIIVIATWDNSLFRGAVVLGAARVVMAAGLAASVFAVGKVLLTVIAVGVAVVLVGAALEVMIETVQKIAEAVAEAVGMALDWAGDQIAALRDFIGEQMANIGEWLKTTFNDGYRYATEHPIIKVDTYKLRSYSQRLERINSRLQNLDRRMDGLYFKVGLLDAWSLIQADLMVGRSFKIKQNMTYLEQTASDFERVEKNISQYV